MNLIFFIYLNNQHKFLLYKFLLIIRYTMQKFIFNQNIRSFLDQNKLYGIYNYTEIRILPTTMPSIIRLSSQITLLLLLLSISISIADTKQLSINLQHTIIQTNRQWSSIKLKVEGGVSPSNIYFDEIPTGWKQVRNQLHANNKDIELYKKFPCKIRVYDSSGNSISGTVVLLSRNNMLEVSPQIYDYNKQFDNSFYYSTGCYGKPKMEQNKLSINQAKTSNKNSSQTHNGQHINRDQYFINQIRNISQIPGAGLKQISKIISQRIRSNTQIFERQFKFPQTNYIYKNTAYKTWNNTSPNNNSTKIKDELRKQLDFSIKNTFHEQQKQGNLRQQSVKIQNSQKQPLLHDINRVEPVNGIKKVQPAKVIQKVQLQQIKKVPVQPIKQTVQPTKQAVQPIKQAVQPIKQAVQPTQKSGIIILAQKPLQNNSSVVNNLQNVKTGPIQQLKSIFSKLPSSQQLDQIILAADQYSILKTMQNTIQSDQLSCEHKYLYLSDFLGRIHSAVAMKTFAMNQLQVIIEMAKQQIARLNGQIQYFRTEKQSLKLNQIRSALENQLLKIQGYYNLFNENQLKISSPKGKIIGYEEDIKILKNASDENRAKIQLQKLKLTEIDANIAILERQLQEAKSYKQIALKNITKIEQTLANDQLKIDRNYVSIDDLQQQIDKIETQSDRLKNIYSDLQIVVDRLNGDMKRAEKREGEINQKIEGYEQRIELQRQKLVIQQFVRIQAMVKNLKDRLPTLEEEIYRINYQCYSVPVVSQITAIVIIPKNVKSIYQEKQSKSVFIIGNKDFDKYIKDSYAIQATKKLFLSGSLQISIVNILSKQWESTFGAPFTKQQIQASQQFSFSDDFNCLNSSQVQQFTGSGIIKTINARNIIVSQADGRTIRLNLGVCTRLQSTQQLPKIGQNIYFKGSQIGKEQFNIYRASCI